MAACCLHPSSLRVICPVESVVGSKNRRTAKRLLDKHMEKSDVRDGTGAFLEPPPANSPMSNSRGGSGSSSVASCPSSYIQSPLNSPATYTSHNNGKKEDGNRMKRKLVVVGDGGSGKTSLLFAYKDGEFKKDYVPTVFENHRVTVGLDNKKYVDLALWDTAGQEDYDRLRPLSYPDSHVILMCFAIDNPISLDNVRLKWKHELDLYVPNVPKIVVGCKSDLRKEKSEDSSKNLVSFEHAHRVASEVGAVSYIECSAKTRENVIQVFTQAARASLTVSKPGKKKSLRSIHGESLASPLTANGPSKSTKSLFKRKCIIQ